MIHCVGGYRLQTWISLVGWYFLISYDILWKWFLLAYSLDNSDGGFRKGPGHGKSIWQKQHEPLSHHLESHLHNCYLDCDLRKKNINLHFSVQFSLSVLSDSLRPHGLQYARPPCPSPTPGVHPNSCPLSRWCHPTISSSDVPFSSCLQSFPAPASFQMSQFFTSGGQSIGVSALASVLPMNTQDWSPLGWIVWIF